jgi:hypothetical protein
MRDNEPADRPTKKRVEARARITQQFREAANMTYELDCEGNRLILRIFPIETAPDEEWRVEARTSDSPDAVVASATAKSRIQAFDAVASWWREHALSRALVTFDWDAVATAMTTVRAL